MPTPRLTAPRRSGIIAASSAILISLFVWAFVSLATSGALVWQPSMAIADLLDTLAATITVCAMCGAGLWWLALRMMYGQHSVSATVDRRNDMLDSIGGSLTDLHSNVEDLTTQIAALRRDGTARTAAVLESLGAYAEEQWAAGYEARDADTSTGPELVDSLPAVRPIRSRTPHHHHTSN